MTTLTPYPQMPAAIPRVRSLTAFPGHGLDAPPCPGRLLAMVCDAAWRFLVTAEAAMAAGWAATAADDIHRAQGILLEMLASVEREAVPSVPDAAAAFARLCQHLIDRLFEAVSAADVARLREARRLLTGLRDAWAAV